MPTAVQIHGRCEPKFLGVQEAFQANFEKHGEVGASLSVVVAGKVVVDLWGGHKDAARTQRWQQNTIVNVWSATKGIVATCAHKLAEEGHLDLNAPVAEYWPEFRQAGKFKLPVRYLLAHSAGLPAISEPLAEGSEFDWKIMTDALAKQKPWWTPGTQTGYHALTFGWLVGEVIRRVAKKSVGAYFRDAIATPLNLDFHIGLPKSEFPRVAEVIPAMPDPDTYLAKHLSDPESMQFKMIFNPPDQLMPNTVNTDEWRAAEIPAANGHSNGRALAAFYGALANGQILSHQTIQNATKEQFNGVDYVMGIPGRFALGYVLMSESYPMGAGENNFGHSGAGGSMGFADPDARLGFGYGMNRMLSPIKDSVEDVRWRPMMDAVYAAL